MVSNKTLTLALLLLAVFAWQQLNASKIAYKKPIYGKSNYIKEKRYRLKADAAPKPRYEETSTSTTSAPTTSTQQTEDVSPTVEFIIQQTTPRAEDVSTQEQQTTIQLEATTYTALEQSTVEPSADCSTSSERTNSLERDSNNMAENSTSSSNQIVETSTVSTAIVSLSTPAAVTAVLAAPVPANQPVPCTCGVFLSSQIQKGVLETPLILSEQDRMFPCNAIGRKQCQTKCLEAIVQHLPNSANIVCATLGRDCHKERAYLFIKNCQNQWWNTNLQAGREYCCKSGTPYRCPLMG